LVIGIVKGFIDLIGFGIVDRLFIDIIEGFIYEAEIIQVYLCK